MSKRFEPSWRKVSEWCWRAAVPPNWVMEVWMNGKGKFVWRVVSSSVTLTARIAFDEHGSAMSTCERYAEWMMKL